MKSVNPYLNFPGNTLEAFEFYRSVFGGEFVNMTRFRDTPEAGRVAPQDLDKIMHIALPIAGGAVLMATDALESMGHTINSGNNFHLAIETDSTSEADRILGAISAGGRVIVPASQASWGAYFGMATDKFGISWMVNYDPAVRPTFEN